MHIAQLYTIGHETFSIVIDTFNYHKIVQAVKKYPHKRTKNSNNNAI